jgi:hypothetical protein
MARQQLTKQLGEVMRQCAKDKLEHHRCSSNLQHTRAQSLHCGHKLRHTICYFPKALNKREEVRQGIGKVNLGCNVSISLEVEASSSTLRHSETLGVIGWAFFSK